MASILRNGVARIERTSQRLPAPLSAVGTGIASWAKGTFGSIVGAEDVFGKMALTFDDGPHPDITPRILDVLDTHGAQATFFVLVAQAQMHSDVLHETIRRGHEVALHTRTHPRLTDLSSGALDDEIRRARYDLEQVAQNPVTWFRPPFGAQSLRSYRAARSSGMEVVVWDAWAHDWEDLPAQQVVDNATKRASAGGILLLHDSHVTHPDRRDAPAPTFDRPVVVAEILEWLVAARIQPVSVGELLDEGRPRRSIWFESGS